MNGYQRIRLGRILSTEFCRRLLIRYFSLKGFENFDAKVFPPLVQDLPQLVPELAARVEVEPFVLDVDPGSGLHRLGWNLFVLGNRRLYLGESSHFSMAELASGSSGPQELLARSSWSSPRRVVKFVTSVLGNSQAGCPARAVPGGPQAFQPTSARAGSGHGGYFRTVNRTVL